jgi:nicotinamidase-related amidase
VLLIDVVNPFEFPGADRLLRQALPVAGRIAALAERARAARVPVVYVNDHFGDWRCGFERLVARCTREGARGRAFVERLAPRPGDYHVLKPRHSGFLSTSLDPLLADLGAGSLVLAGVAAHICVLFTAIDAYMRGHALVVVRDGVASEDPSDRRYALELMGDVLKARIAPARAVGFAPGRRRPR